MKHSYALACALLFALTLVAPFTTGAAELPETSVNRPSNLTKHVVADRETLSGQAGNDKLQDEANWRQLLAWNPTVGDPGRFKVLVNGQKKPATFEEAMTFLGEAPIFFYWKKPQEFWGLQELGFKIANNQTPVAAATQTAEVVESVINPNPQPTSNLNWLWTLLIWLAIAAFAVYALRRWGWPWYVRKHRLNPTTAGPAQVVGGVNAATVQDVILRRAMNEYQGVGAVEDFRIVHLQQGTGHGPQIVKYGNGKTSTRMLTGEEMFHALVQLPDGRREERDLMTHCGNETRGTGLSYARGMGFEFRPTQTIIELQRQGTQVFEPVATQPQITREDIEQSFRTVLAETTETKPEQNTDLVIRRSVNGAHIVTAGVFGPYNFGDLTKAGLAIEPIIDAGKVVGFTINGLPSSLVFRENTINILPSADSMDGDEKKALSASAGAGLLTAGTKQ